MYFYFLQTSLFLTNKNELRGLIILTIRLKLWRVQIKSLFVSFFFSCSFSLSPSLDCSSSNVLLPIYLFLRNNQLISPSPHRFHLLTITTGRHLFFFLLFGFMTFVFLLFFLFIVDMFVFLIDLRTSRRWKRPDPSLLSTPSASYSRGTKFSLLVYFDLNIFLYALICICVNCDG